MSLEGFDQLYRCADARPEPLSLAVAGGDDPTVLEALQIARNRGWVKPILVGPEARIRLLAQTREVSLTGFAIVHAEGEAVARAAVAQVRSGAAGALLKGQISTPALMEAVLCPSAGIRSDRVVCQVVLMEIPRDDRRFLLADTGICINPSLKTRIDILRGAVEIAHALGVAHPKVALLAATETVKDSMPETVEAAELVRRNQQGEFSDCSIAGPLSFDLAYAAEAGARKRVEGAAIGAADILLFPNLLSANLTVKAIMYTADCRFGGVLFGTAAPVAFMSRADTTETRLNSLALSLRILDH
jgi:phosphotransacetylase